MTDPFALPSAAPKRRRAVIISGLVVIGLVAAGSAALMGVGGASMSGYRTATVATRSVDQTLTEVGVVQPVSQATVAFPVSGTVAGVDVAAGDEVRVGQALATLDTTTLQATVDQRQAALDQAELTLEKALSGESVGTPSGTSNIQTIAFTPGATSANGADAQLAAAQRAVVDTQQQVDEDLASAQHALDAARTTCGSSSGSSTGDSTTTTTTTPHDDASSACATALTAALQAQQQLSNSQNALVQASNTLDTLLGQRAAASASQGSDNDAGANGGTGRAPAAGGANSGANRNSPSAQDLIAYQKAVDAAAVQLAVAQQALAQATITSPIQGTVAAVNIAVGDDVSSASSTQNLVVVGEGGFEVTTSIGVDDLPDVAVGQRATIQPDGAGSGTPIAGRIVAIGLSGTSTSSTTTYPVIIGLDGDTSSLRNGSLATVTIVTKSSAARLSVPTSAVATNGNTHTVRVVDGGGDPKTVDVQLGAIGAKWTEITSGLSAGQRVVIADIGAPLPSSATASSNGNTGNTGRFFPGGARFAIPNR